MNAILEKLSEEVREALTLLSTTASLADEGKETRACSTGERETLIQQCLELLRAQTEAETEPLRMIHHFACTGGTLFSKCLASMPNVQLLSEVDPLSTLTGDEAAAFAPTDFVKLLRDSSRGSDSSLVKEMFLAQVQVLHKNYTNRGTRLVLRDHMHSCFCTAADPNSRETVHEMLSKDFSIKSAITVRHPADSFASLRKNGWVQFEPNNLEEYCGRYLMFLDRHEHAPIFRYEDLIEDSRSTMNALCGALGLAYNESFEQLFPHFKLSGDSGRKGDVISSRFRTDDAQSLSATTPSGLYDRLCKRLGYSS